MIKGGYIKYFHLDYQKHTMHKYRLRDCLSGFTAQSIHLIGPSSDVWEEIVFLLSSPELTMYYFVLRINFNSILNWNAFLFLIRKVCIRLTVKISSKTNIYTLEYLLKVDLLASPSLHPPTHRQNVFSL